MLLNVHCINVRSVKNKATSVSDLVISRDIDILGLTEAWLGSAIDGHVINTFMWDSAHRIVYPAHQASVM